MKNQSNPPRTASVRTDACCSACGVNVLALDLALLFKSKRCYGCGARFNNASNGYLAGLVRTFLSHDPVRCGFCGTAEDWIPCDGPRPDCPTCGAAASFRLRRFLDVTVTMNIRELSSILAAAEWAAVRGAPVALADRGFLQAIANRLRKQLPAKLSGFPLSLPEHLQTLVNSGQTVVLEPGLAMDVVGSIPAPNFDGEGYIFGPIAGDLGAIPLGGTDDGWIMRWNGERWARDRRATLAEKEAAFNGLENQDDSDDEG